MLEIKIENKNLDLFPNTKLSFSINSTIWEFNQIAGSFTLPFELPLTPLNQNILDFPFHNSVLKPEEYTYSCEIYVKGILFKTGILSITNTNNSKINANIIVNISKISEYANKKLSELDIYGGDQDWIWKPEYFPNIDGFALPQIKDENYLEDTLFFGRNRDINEYHFARNQYRAQASCEFSGIAYEKNTPLVPQPSLIYIITKLFNFFGYSLDINFSHGLELLIIMNVNDAISIEYSSNDDGFYHVLEKFNLKNHLPDITVGEFLVTFTDFFACHYNIIGNNVYINSIKDYINNNNYIDFSEKSSFNKTLTQIKPITGINIKWENGHDDKFTQYPQFQDLISQEPMRGEYLPNSPEINSTPPNAGFINWHIGDGKTGFYVSKYFGNNDIYYEWISPFTESNILSPKTCLTGQNYFKNIFNNSNILTVNLKLSPIAVNEIDQKGCSNLTFDKTKNKNYRLRLAYYTYLNNVSEIPPGIKSYQGGYVTPVVSLNLNLKYNHELGQAGPYYKFWEPVFNYLKTIEYQIEQKLLLSQKELMFFDFSKKYKIENNLFFVKSLKYSIDINGNFSETTAVLMPVFS